MGTDRLQPLTLICNYPNAKLYTLRVDLSELKILNVEVILEELKEEAGGLKKAGTIYTVEVMYWTGYVYRYWHYYTGEFSQEIYSIADAETMQESWLGFHTFDSAMAVDNLKEIYRQKYLR